MPTSPRSRRRSALRLLAATSAALLSIIALVGAAHTPWARPLLQRLGGCPVGRATPAQVEAAQRKAWKVLKGADRAPARPALAFALGETTLSQIQAWGAARGLACEQLRDGALLRCGRVPAAAWRPGAEGVYDDVSFGFRLSDRRLVNVTALRTGLEASEAAAVVRAIAAGLERTLGVPTHRGAGAGQAVVLYRFADYVADVAEMQLPGRGHAIREHYMSALD